MKKIYYLCFYDVVSNKNKQRIVHQSSFNKINSIIEELLKLGYRIEIVSMSWTLGHNDVPEENVVLNDKLTVKLFSSLGRKNVLTKILTHILIRIKYFLYLYMNINNGDVVISYHMLEYSKIICLLRKLKGFKFISEFEEMYADVIGGDRIRITEMEELKCADSFIFPSEKMNNILNTDSLPSAICYGPYVFNSRVSLFKDFKIHIVYAGTFMENKGVLEAIKAAAYLSDNYVVHILGTGTENEVKKVKDQIETTYERGNAKVIYEGELTGKQFYEFMSSCDIGLSPQDSKARYTLTSFPSKVLTYISCGLRVVSIDIDTIKSSKVSKYIYFYHEQTPQEIARTIQQVDLNSNYDYQGIIRNLQSDFEKELKNIIEGE